MRVQLQQLRELRRCNKKTAGIPMLKKAREYRPFFLSLCVWQMASQRMQRDADQDLGYTLI